VSVFGGMFGELGMFGSVFDGDFCYVLFLFVLGVVFGIVIVVLVVVGVEIFFCCEECLLIEVVFLSIVGECAV